MDTIELDDITQRRQRQQLEQRPQQRSENNFYLPAAILLLLGSLLAFFPGFVHYLASQRGSDLTALERFLSIQFGLYLLAFAVSLLFNTDSHPLIIPLTASSSVASFLAYNTTPSHGLATIFFLANLVIALAGYVTILFANEPPYISKTTGADKRTSAFIFGNKSAASQIKKAWRSDKQSK